MAEDPKLAVVDDNGHSITSYQREYIESLRPKYDLITVHMRDHVTRSVLLLFRHVIVVGGRKYHHSGAERIPADEPKQKQAVRKSTVKPKITAKKRPAPKKKSAAKPKVAA
jgi:hypothetical protein